MEAVQMSAFIFSRELSIFDRVFLMRNAVSLADGLWYQHSFISLTIDVRVWKTKKQNKTKNQEYVFLSPDLLFTQKSVKQFKAKCPSHSAK